MLLKKSISQFIINLLFIFIIFILLINKNQSLFAVLCELMLLSISNSVITAYYNHHNKNKYKSLHAWLYSLFIVLIPLFIVFIIYMFESGSLIKYGDDFAAMFMLLYLSTVIIIVSISYWCAYFIIKNPKRMF